MNSNNDNEEKESWPSFEFRLRELEEFVRKAGSLCVEPHLISQDAITCLNNVLFSFDGGKEIESTSLVESISRSCDQLRVIQQRESALEAKYTNKFDKLSRSMSYYKDLSGSLCEQIKFVSAKENVEDFIESNPLMRGSSVSTINGFYDALFNAEEPSKWHKDVVGVGSATSNKLVEFLSKHAPNSIELFLLRCDFSTTDFHFGEREGGLDKHDNLFDRKLCLTVDGMGLNINIKLLEEYFCQMTPMIEFSGEFICNKGIAIKGKCAGVRPEQEECPIDDLLADDSFLET